MAQPHDDLPMEAERYVMPSHFVESDSLEVQGFVTSALRPVCAPSVSPPLWASRMCATT